jgi:GMP reductase
MQILNDLKLDFDDVLIQPSRSSLDTRDIPLEREFRTRSGNTIKCTPIIVANMDTTGTFEMAKSMYKHHALVALNKHYPVEDLKKNWNLNNTFITFGMSEKDISKMKELEDTISKEWISPKICLDVANGYTDKFVSHVAKVREKFPKAIIMAGNVCTPEMTQAIILAGADIVKIGIGSGSVCTTRLTAGVGYPQFSAIVECKNAAHGLKNGLICSDGGCRRGCDVSKAFGGGADFVMLGGAFAGTDECEGEWETKTTPYRRELIGYEPTIKVSDIKVKLDPGLYPGAFQNIDDGDKEFRRFSYNKPIYEESGGPQKVALKFYGMSSKEANDKYNGGVKPYKTAEGKCVKIPYKGPAEKVLLDIMGSVRSGCTYVGAESLKDYSKCCTFIRVSRTHNTVYE